MAVNWVNAVKDSRMTTSLAAIDANSSAAFIELLTASSGLLATILLAKPSFSEASQRLTMLSGPRSGSCTASGTLALAQIKDGGGSLVVSGFTVGTSGTDFLLSALAVSIGQNIVLSSGTITAG